MRAARRGLGWLLAMVLVLAVDASDGVYAAAGYDLGGDPRPLRLSGSPAPRYPCAFQQKQDGRWRGTLSLRKANRLRARSVQVGQRIAVRLNDVTQADAFYMIECVAKAYGMAPGPFHQVAECESHHDPEAYNPAGPFEGMFQYLPSTWASSSQAYDHAGAPATDGYAQIHVTVQKVRAEGWGAWGICI